MTDAAKPMNAKIGSSLAIVGAFALWFSEVHSSTRDELILEGAGSNPFSPFFGEWTLKKDEFRQVFDGKNVQTLKISNHRTHCERINTDRSVLCVVDAGELKGHIMWSYDTDKRRVHHLSHFGSSRNGVGVGFLDAQSNLRLNVSFQDEPGTYRIYEYTWVSKDEYTMMSRQFANDGTPTGNWYGGTFIRFVVRGG